jgi:curved DNA-binding protein CbpA
MPADRKQNHYRTLGITRNAAADDVRKAFRTMTKKFHPDRNIHRQSWATDQMRTIIEAHRVLSNQDLRSAYDLQEDLQAEREHKRSNLRPKGRPEGGSSHSCAERLLYDLLTGNIAQAIKDYDALLKKDAAFDLATLLDERDWIDCKFLLAEGYEKRSRYDRALSLYEDLYRNNIAKERSAFFRNEVRDRIVHICCQGPARSAPPEEAAQYYLRALALDLPRNRKAFLHKKIAECCLRVGDDDTARRHLSIAFDMKPDLKGVTKICNRLGFTAGQPGAAS